MIETSSVLPRESFKIFGKCSETIVWRSDNFGKSRVRLHIKLNTRREIPYLRAQMYYPLHMLSKARTNLYTWASKNFLFEFQHQFYKKNTRIQKSKVRFSSIEIQFDKVRLTMDKTTYLFIEKERKEEYNNNLKLISWTFKRGAKRLNKGKTDWRTAIGHWSVHNRARDRLKCGNSSEGSIINNLTEEALLLWYLSFYWHRFHDNRFAFSRLRKGQR